MPDPCTLHVQIRQTFRGPVPVGVYYRIPQLASRWQRKPSTVFAWLSRLRQTPWAPTPEQVKRIGPNRAVRYVEIREDYAGFMRQVFMDRIPPENILPLH